MINKSDFVLTKNGLGNIKCYRAYCDICGTDRGYKRERDGKRPCRACTKRPLTPSNVDIGDTIEHQDSTKRLYKMCCPTCGNDRGYLALSMTYSQCHSCAMRSRWKTGGMAHAKSPKRKFNYIKNGQTIFFKSSYELAYAKYLDSKDINWTYEPIYPLSDGTNILPDFLLEDGTVVEIKGYFRPDAQVKWNKFCNEYIAIKKILLMKTDLEQLDII